MGVLARQRAKFTRQRGQRLPVELAGGCHGEALDVTDVTRPLVWREFAPAEVSQRGIRRRALLGDQRRGHIADHQHGQHHDQKAKELQEEQQALRTQREQLLALGDDMTAKTQLKQIERDLRYLELCLQNAIVVATSPSQAEIRFGAAVEVVDEDGTTRQFRIVGEHEACAPSGLISWVSPLARSLIGRRVGDVILWERPAGNVELEITEVSYPEWS